MKYYLVALINVLSNVGYGQQRTGEDAENLKAVLAAYFNGVKNKDHQKMIDATTPDFIVYEEGKVWNNDSVFREMDRQKYSVEFRFEGHKINISQSLAHMSYLEHADFVFNDTTKRPLKFVGSAAFQKVNGKWKMSFMQATKKFVYKKK